MKKQLEEQEEELLARMSHLREEMERRNGDADVEAGEGEGLRLTPSCFKIPLSDSTIRSAGAAAPAGGRHRTAEETLRMTEEAAEISRKLAQAAETIPNCMRCDSALLLLF